MSVPPSMPVPPSTANPFGPPPVPPAPIPAPHQATQPQYAAQPQPQPYPPAHPAAPQWAPPQPYQAPPKQGNARAITAVVLSGLALAGVIVLGAMVAFGPAMGPSWVLQGEAPVRGGTVGAAQLERTLRDLMEDDGSAVDEISCPESSTVDQGLVTVCHGSVDGWDWTGVGVFEDPEGTFTLNQL